MRSVKPPAAHLEKITPYDPKYLPADVLLSANENPYAPDADLSHEIIREIKKVPLNRYPDPLANELRDLIAGSNGLERECVLVGNGGDELLFDLSLAWGGRGRRFLNMPPTFSVYADDAVLTETEIVNINRREDFTIDEEAVLERVAYGDIDYIIVTSPNNPTGNVASEQFIEKLLSSTDALVMVDEAYFEFSRSSVRPYLNDHENLVILRTFSKAFSLAGVRIGYILASPYVINQFIKVRQPYSVDAVSQAIAKVVYKNRSKFEPRINGIISERKRVMDGLSRIPHVKAYPSESNYILFRIPFAPDAWYYLYQHGVLVRDFSGNPLLPGCLRVSIGTAEENNRFLGLLRDFVMEKEGAL